MWARNLLFIGLVLGGFAALRASLFPLDAALRHRPPTVTAPTPTTPPAPVDPTVAELNTLFAEQWAAQKLEPAPAASDWTVIRRLGLALTGTVPSLQEIRQLERVPAEQRVTWWLEHLLRDRRCGDYLAERLARTYVGTEDGPFIVYRRRRFVRWLSDQVLANRPYGDVVTDLISADGLWTDHPATNFITVTFDPNRQGPDPERLAARVARAFLGVRLDCAQCHDDKLNERWEQKDFHALAAFFGRTQQGLTGIHDAATGEHTMKIHRTGQQEVVPPAVPFHPELLPTDGTRRSQLARWVTHPQNEYFARATVVRMWALLFGRPLLDAVDSLDAVEQPPRALLVLARDFTEYNYDLHRLIRLIATSRVYQLDSAADHEITDRHEKAWAVFPLSRLRPEQVASALQQAAAVKTIDGASPLLVRAGFYNDEKDFVRRYGDTGEDEFVERGGTIPQRLLLLNGDLVHAKTRGEMFNAARLIASMAPDDRSAVELAYRLVLTRPPTPPELAHFEARLAGVKGGEREQRLEDLYWTLLNSTEFSWNH